MSLIKYHGGKTKLVKFILSNILWNGKGRWIEPFLGSGVVLFNVEPEHALVNDINPHIIRLYQMLYDGKLSYEEVKSYLLSEGKKLSSYGEEYYYFVRERFNKTIVFIRYSKLCETKNGNSELVIGKNVLKM